MFMWCMHVCVCVFERERGKTKCLYILVCGVCRGDGEEFYFLFFELVGLLTLWIDIRFISHFPVEMSLQYY